MEVNWIILILKNTGNYWCLKEKYDINYFVRVNLLSWNFDINALILCLKTWFWIWHLTKLEDDEVDDLAANCTPTATELRKMFLNVK